MWWLTCKDTDVKTKIFTIKNIGWYEKHFPVHNNLKWYNSHLFLSYQFDNSKKSEKVRIYMRWAHAVYHGVQFKKTNINEEFELSRASWPLEISHLWFVHKAGNVFIFLLMSEILERMLPRWAKMKISSCENVVLWYLATCGRTVKLIGRLPNYKIKCSCRYRNFIIPIWQKSEWLSKLCQINLHFEVGLEKFKMALDEKINKIRTHVLCCEILIHHYPYVILLNHQLHKISR